MAANIRLPNVNRVLLVGRVTQDTNLIFSDKGMPYCNFTLACNNNYKNKNTGEWVKNTAFINVGLRGPVAERLCDNLKKGVPVFVEGYITSYKKEVGGVNLTKMIVRALRAQILEYKQSTEVEYGVETKTETPIETESNETKEDDLPPVTEGDELPF